MTALLFLVHATMKFFQYPAPIPGVPYPLPPLEVVAGIIEAATGVLILVGFWTRLAAFIASGEMAVAYFLVHAPRGFWPVMNHGESAVLFCFVFLYLAAAGPGIWSLDERRLRSV